MRLVKITIGFCLTGLLFTYHSLAYILHKYQKKSSKLTVAGFSYWKEYVLFIYILFVCITTVPCDGE